MYVLARSAPRAPLACVFWTGELTEIELDDGARVRRAEVGLFPDDGYWLRSIDAALNLKARHRQALAGFVPVPVRPQRPPNLPLH